MDGRGFARIVAVPAASWLESGYGDTVPASASHKNDPVPPRHETSLPHDIAAWSIAGFLLLLALFLHLLPALFAGLLVYELVHVIAPRLRIGKRGKVAAV